MVKLSLNKLENLFEKLAKTSKVYLPVDSGKVSKFKEWNKGDVMSSALNTDRSAKDFFFPQTENLINFKMSGKNIEIIQPDETTTDFILFGVRACDARSFEILDKVFLTGEVDTFYKSKREHGTVVTLACTKPAETCFCGVFGIDASNPGGDVATWIENGEIYFTENTEKGKALLKKISDLTEETSCEIVDKQKEEIKKIMAKLPINSLPTENLTKENLLEIFNSKEWANMSQSCLGCGSCTFVCPTCQCYDIRDLDTGHGIRRLRCWDSCMYSDFTKMAAENPRHTQLERFRQRFMHKLVYFPINNQGTYGCVGCGRCILKCPSSMNIVKVAKALGGNGK